MAGLALELREKLCGGLPRQPEINGIGAQSDLLAPPNLPARAEMDACKKPLVAPCLEDALGREIGQVHGTVSAVRKHHPESVVGQRANRNRPNHNLRPLHRPAHLLAAVLIALQSFVQQRLKVGLEGDTLASCQGAGAGGIGGVKINHDGRPT